LEVVGARRPPRHAHVDAILERTLRIAGAQAALRELRHMVDDQVESRAVAGRKIGRAVRAALRNALHPLLKVVQEVGGFLQASTMKLEPWMHVHAEGGLRTAQGSGLVVLDGL